MHKNHVCCNYSAVECSDFKKLRMTTAPAAGGFVSQPHTTKAAHSNGNKQVSILLPNNIRSIIQCRVSWDGILTPIPGWIEYISLDIQHPHVVLPYIPFPVWSQPNKQQPRIQTSPTRWEFKVVSSKFNVFYQHLPIQGCSRYLEKKNLIQDFSRFSRSRGDPDVLHLFFLADRKLAILK